MDVGIDEQVGKEEGEKRERDGLRDRKGGGRERKRERERE